MNITYNRMDDPDVNVTSANCHLPLYGRWCALHITSYCVGGGTAITFGLRPSVTTEVKSDRMNALFGILRLARGRDGNRQVFDQSIDVPNVIGQLLDWSELTDGGTPAGRTVSQALLRRMESIVETVRHSIVKKMGKEVKDQALKELDDRFGAITRTTVLSFLGEINWRLMLQGAGLDDDAANVIDYTLANNPIDMYSLLWEDETDIPLIAHAELNRFDRTTLANIKATTLLKKVCGEELSQQFDQKGKIVLYEYDYRFEIAPGQFVHCTDPNGKTARLCIHTIGLSCNPIDEVIISYLHIRNKFDEWMKMAIVHGAEKGFQRKRVA